MARLSGMAQQVVFALAIVALLALASLRLSKGERLPPPPETTGFALPVTR